MSAIGQLLTNFGVTWDRLLGQVITFAVLVVVLRLVLYKPMLKMLDERKSRIAQGMKDASAAAEAKAQSEKEAAERLRQATRQAEELLDEAKKAAETVKAQIAAQAQADLDRARKDQEASLARAQAEMMNEVRRDVARLVVSTTGKVLQSELTKDQQQKVLSQAAKELE